MKRTVPLLITGIAGFVLIVSFFLPAIQEWGEDAAVWFDILASIAFILGGGNLLTLHLKAMSDRKAGWGYSGITIIAFFVTLMLGFLKIGSPPTANEEFFGETFVKFPLSAMPEYRVPGALPQRADDEPLPPDVRRQLREEDGQLIFRGWMVENQKDDLLKYYEKLNWQCQVEQLFTASQPQNLKNQIRYDPKHQALSVKGVLSAEIREQLEKVLPDSSEKQSAIADLVKQSHRQTTIVARDIPETFRIPLDAQSILTREGSALTLTGPLTKEMHKKLVGEWAGFPPALPLTTEQENALKRELESRGEPLTAEQAAVFQKHFAAEWEAEVLIAAINTAAVPPADIKPACELFREQAAGAEELDARIPSLEPVFLNSDQVQAVEIFVEQPGEQTAAELKTSLEGLGPLTADQAAAIHQFLDSLPRGADELKVLGLKLLQAGPLSSEQRDFLFAPVAAQYAWKTSVETLSHASHQVKSPWSGDYSAQGNPFWWVYEYVLQPLMTTTFAVLAFYVASAAFRAFRAKNLEATLLLGTAFIVLLGRTYLGVQLTSWIPDSLSALKIDQMTVYIMKIFNTAGNRAIMIGIALGIASTSLKVLLGIDRSYLGSGDD